MTTDAHDLLLADASVAEAGAAVADTAIAPRCRSRVLAPALASSLLLWLCYFPAAWGWLAWVALVPLLALVRADASRKRIYTAAFVAGLAFYAPVLQWIRVADDRMYATWIALTFHCSFFLVLGIALLRVLDRRTRLPLVLSVPVVWTSLEFMRGTLAGGFPWYFLAHSQHDYLALTQISDLGGAYTLSFLLAAANALLFEWLLRTSWFRQLLRLPEPVRPVSRALMGFQTLAMLCALGGTLAYGIWRLGQNEFATGPEIALIQSNLDQRVRNLASTEAGTDAADSMLLHNARLSDWAAVQKPLPQLIVWPETSCPRDWTEVPSEVSVKQLPLERRRQLDETRDLARWTTRWKTNVLLGLNCVALGSDERWRRYNSAVLIQNDAVAGGRYDKMHRVPFGEFVPFREELPFMNRFAPYDNDYSVAPGETFTRFPLGDYRFGVVICYEDTDPALARQYVGNDGPPVDFLLNISNDGWFDGTSEHEQHLAICRFRAIECRRTVARAVNMGISAVIDGNGRVLRPEAIQPNDKLTIWRLPASAAELPVSEWQHFKKTAGVFAAAVPLDRRTSLYGLWGDWLPWFCWLMLGVGLLMAVVRPVKG